jgi:hypothetical protein
MLARWALTGIQKRFQNVNQNMTYVCASEMMGELCFVIQLVHFNRHNPEEDHGGEDDERVQKLKTINKAYEYTLTTAASMLTQTNCEFISILNLNILIIKKKK